MDEILYRAERTLDEGKIISFKKVTLSKKFSIAKKVKKNLMFSKDAPETIKLKTFLSKKFCF